MRATSKRFTYDGDKDKNEARTMSDRLGDVDGFRTSVESLPDRDVMLRTRGGNPEVTTTKMKGDDEIALVESKYQLRSFHQTDTSPPAQDYGLSSTLQFLKRIALRSGDKVRLYRPPEKEAGLIDTANYHAGERIFSTDGIFSFVRCSPKKAVVRQLRLRFLPINMLGRDATVEDLEAVATGKAQRKFYDQRIMETTVAKNFNAAIGDWNVATLGRFLKFVVLPIKSVKGRLDGRAVRLMFDEPAPTTTGANDYGSQSLKTNPFDHIQAFGQVYHGLLNTKTGVLTLPSGASHFGQVFSTADHGSSYVEFPKGYEAVTASGMPVGLTFKKFAFLSGQSYQYHPLKKRMCFRTPWLYAADDGAVYAIKDNGTGLIARLVDFMSLSADENSVDMWHNESEWQQVFTGEIYYGQLTASKDGKQAVYGGNRGGFSWPNSISYTPGRWQQFSVSGGSFTSFPSISVTNHSEATTGTLPTGDGSATVTVFVGALMTGAATVIKAYEEWSYELTTSHGYVVHQRVACSGNIDGAAHAIDGFTYTATVTETSPGIWNLASAAYAYDNLLGRNAGTNPLAYFGCGVRSYNSGLFELRANGKDFTHAKYVGTLGGTLDQGVLAYPYPSDVNVYTQHPVTGTLLTNQLPF